MRELVTGHEAEMAEREAEMATPRTAEFLREIADRLGQAADLLDAGEPVPDVFAQFGGPTHLTAEQAALSEVLEARANLADWVCKDRI